ncbi:MAG TPA: hypothetical protein VIT92_09330 [Burkholderiaceae bacterium]
MHRHFKSAAVLLLAFCATGAYAADKACLVESTVVRNGKTTQFKDCMQNISTEKKSFWRTARRP